MTQLGQDGRPHVILFAGRSIRPNETRFFASEIELLAVMSGIRHFHTYLAHNKFTEISDHVSSKYITSLRAEYGRLGRWAMYLMNYNFEIKHAPGTSVVISVADGLSRREYDPEPERDIEEEFQDKLLALGALADGNEVKPQRVPKTLLVEFTYKSQSPDNSVNVIGESPTLVSVELQDIIPLQRNCPYTKPFFDYFESGSFQRTPKLRGN